MQDATGVIPTAQRDDNIDDMARNIATGDIDEARHPHVDMGNEAAASRQPKGDHNRRLSLGLDPDRFAQSAGITTDQLREYENTLPDGKFNLEVATLVGEALDRLEAQMPNSETGRSSK